MKNIALDLADDIQLALPALTSATVARLTAQLPSFAVAENPLDYTTIGIRQPGLIGEILDTLAADPRHRQPAAGHPRRPGDGPARQGRTHRAGDCPHRQAGGAGADRRHRPGSSVFHGRDPRQRP